MNVTLTKNQYRNAFCIQIRYHLNSGGIVCGFVYLLPSLLIDIGAGSLTNNAILFTIMHSKLYAHYTDLIAVTLLLNKHFKS